MNESLGIAHFLDNADPVAWTVLVLLVGMSIGSWYWIAAKALQSMQSRRRSRSFLAGVRAQASLEATVQAARERGADDPFSRVLLRAFDAIDRHGAAGTARRRMDEAGLDDYLSRTLGRAITDEVRPIERGQTFLATVASTAPFVGLFGTVWGIHNALLAIGTSGSAALDQVAGPVGEALIMTGIGLAVAIPAAAAYNAFARVRRNLRNDLEAFAADLFDSLGTGAALPAPAARQHEPRTGLAREAAATGS